MTDRDMNTRCDNENIEQWFSMCIDFLQPENAWPEDAAFLQKDKKRALSALCSLRVGYTLWKREQDPSASEFQTRYDELIQYTELKKNETDHAYWSCYMKFFLSLGAGEWQKLWDDVDEVLIHLLAEK